MNKQVSASEEVENQRINFGNIENYQYQLDAGERDTGAFGTEADPERQRDAVPAGFKSGSKATAAFNTRVDSAEQQLEPENNRPSDASQ